MEPLAAQFEDYVFNIYKCWHMLIQYAGWNQLTP